MKKTDFTLGTNLRYIVILLIPKTIQVPTITISLTSVVSYCFYPKINLHYTVTGNVLLSLG